MRKYIIMPVLILMFSLLSYNAFSQGPPPPPPGNHGQTGDQQGGSAPIGGGLFILLGLGAIYGSKKLYGLKEKEEEK